MGDIGSENISFSDLKAAYVATTNTDAVDQTIRYI